MHKKLMIEYDEFCAIDNALWNDGALDSAVSRRNIVDGTKVYENYIFADDSVISFVTDTYWGDHWIDILTKRYEGTSYLFSLYRLPRKS